MKIITRLPHTAKEMTNSIFGWDIFRCRDYTNVDRAGDDISVVLETKPVLGYTIILALNLGSRHFFKRIFISAI